MESISEVNDVEVIVFINSIKYAERIHNLFGDLSYKLYVPFLFSDFKIAKIREIFSGEDFEIVKFRNILDFDFNLAKRKYIFYIPKSFIFFNNNLSRFIKASNDLNCILTGFRFGVYSKVRSIIMDDVYLPKITKEDSIEDLATFLMELFPYYYLNIDNFKLTPNFLFGNKNDLLKKKKDIRIAFDTLIK